MLTVIIVSLCNGMWSVMITDLCNYHSSQHFPEGGVPLCHEPNPGGPTDYMINSTFETKDAYA